MVLLVIGAIAAGSNGGLGPGAVLGLVAGVVGATCLVADVRAAPLLAGVGWLTVAGFSRPPYAQLQPTGKQAVDTGLILLGVTAAAAAAGTAVRALPARQAHARPDATDGSDGVAVPPSAGGSALPWSRLDDVNVISAPPAAGPTPVRRSHRSMIRRVSTAPSRAAGLGPGRQLAGLALAAVILPALTAGLTALRADIPLADDLLLYLVALVGIAFVGGFWPAVTAAVAASLLINWYFTPPLRTWTIERPQNLLALLLFVTVAVSVSSLVHLAAHRSQEAARSGAAASTLLGLAQTVLGGDDTPRAVLAHLTKMLGLPAELTERAGDSWVRVAYTGAARVAGPVPGKPREPLATRSQTGTASVDTGAACAGTGATIVAARDNVRLVVFGDTTQVPQRVLAGFAAQAAAALDRDRLRVQAAQAEALAEGNRMRTALLAAVSHDLRTPLASVKASVSSLRQTDVAYPPEDQAALLATIEQGADRLDALIGNLLDMSRLQTGALQPFLRPIALDEVVPLSLHGVDNHLQVRLELPEDLPLVHTDPGLLERALANVVDNAVRYSPAGRPTTVSARSVQGRVLVSVVDHGPGVPPHAREHMFAPFQRLDDRPAGTGIGLGLAVAKGFIEGMGGDIEARETPGGGLTMRVSLPAAPVAAGWQPARS
ncbi:MAG: sensor histidine kinase [Frankiaceae bacterium]